MTVTKQQQLEFAAKHIEKWKSGYDYAVVETNADGHLCVRWPSICTSGITKKEWQQERDKMNDKPEIDNSWHERGELPPVGCECEYKPANDWVKCKVLFAGDSLYVLGVQEFEICVRVLDVDFRPLCTEREKAIDEMANLIARSVFGSAKCQAEKLYDAGYRKINP